MSKRRQRGAGTVEQVGDRWRFRCPDGSGGRFTSPAEYLTEDDARRGLAVFRKGIIGGQFVAEGGMTLAQYVETRWLKRVERHRPRSLKTYRSVWKSQIATAPFASRPLAGLRRRDIRSWVDSMPVQSAAPVSVLRNILASAIDDELIVANPAEKLRLERKKRKDTSPSMLERDAILACEAIPWHVRVVVGVATGTALRPGEWRHLLIEDVKLEANPPRIHVHRGSDQADDTKDGGPRTVPLFGLALELMRAWLAHLPLYAPRNPRGLVFPQPNGKRRRESRPFGTHQREDCWKLYLRAANLREDIRLHDLRHSAATSLLTGEHGGAWTSEEVQHLLGHASVATTEKTYLHPGDRLVLRAAERSVHGGLIGRDESQAITSHPSTSR